MLSFLKGLRLTKADVVHSAWLGALTLFMFALHLAGLTGTNMSWMVALVFLFFAAGYGKELNRAANENLGNRSPKNIFISGIVTAVVLVTLFLLCLRAPVGTYGGAFAVVIWHLYAWQLIKFMTGSCSWKEFNAKRHYVTFRP